MREILPQATLDVRKAAAATIPMARLAEGAVDRLRSDEDAAAFAALSRMAAERIEKAARRVEDLDTFLLDHGASVERLSHELGLSEDGRADVSRLVADLATSRCQHCPGRLDANNATCDGGAHDDANVSGGAACLAEINDAMRFALGLTEALRTQALGTEPPPEPLLTDLQIGFTAKRTMTASCAPGGGADRIKILLPQLGFSFGELAKVPYALAHELICHATQNRSGGNEMRQKCEKHCPWSEGWMDCLAAEAVEDLLLATSPGNAKDWIWKEILGIVKFTREAHRERYMPPPDISSGELWLFKAKVQARDAWPMFETCARYAGIGDEAEIVALRRKFSILYNHADRSVGEREEVGLNLGVHLQRADGPNGVAVVRAAEALVKTRDVDKFVSSIRCL